MDTVLYEVAVVTSHTARITEETTEDLKTNTTVNPVYHRDGLFSKQLYGQSLIQQDFTKPPPFWSTGGLCDNSRQQSNNKHDSETNDIAACIEPMSDNLTSSSDTEAAPMSDNLVPSSDTEGSSDYMSALDGYLTDDAFAQTDLEEYCLIEPENKHGGENKIDFKGDESVLAENTNVNGYKPGDITEDQPSTFSEFGSTVGSSGYASVSSSLHGSRRNSVSSIGQLSRSSSVSEDLERGGRASEENFADVESNESTVSLAERLKKFSGKARVPAKKKLPTLSTIFSPGNKLFGELQSDVPSRCFSNDIYNEASDVTEALSSDGDTTDALTSSLNPLSRPFIPRALRLNNDLTLTSSSDSEDYITAKSSSVSEISSKTNTHKLSDKSNVEIAKSSKTLGITTKYDSGFSSHTDVSLINSTKDKLHAELSNVVNDSAYFSGHNTTCDLGDSHNFAFPTTQPICNFSSQNACFTDEENYFYSARIDTHPEIRPVNTKTDIAAPFNCTINHRNDFCSARKFSIAELPSTCQNFSKWDTIMSVSHRVVRLSVTKSTNIVNTDPKQCDINDLNNDEQFEHFGTGFACVVTNDTLEVRTHVKLVSSAAEASKTLVTFSLDIKREGIFTEISCFGVKDGFRSNIHTQTSIFRCCTPPDLKRYMYLFKEVPTKSSGLYDSSYFSESGSDSSLDIDKYNNQSQDLYLSNTALSQFHLQLPLINREGNSCSNSDILSEIVDSLDAPPYFKQAPAIEWNKEVHVKNVFRQSSGGILSSSPRDNYFGYCAASESDVKNAFESIASFEYTSKNGGVEQQSNWGQTSSTDQSPWMTTPLSIMENRASESGFNSCPYKDQNVFQSIGEYNYFSSHAGDVITSSLPTFQRCPNLSPFSDQTKYGLWEYEGLVHAQTHHREVYNQTHDIKPMEYISSFSERTSCLETSEDVLSSSAESGLSSKQILANINFDSPSYHDVSPDLGDWDKDILNLDDNLNMLPGCGYYEDMIDDLVTDTEVDVDYKDNCRSCYRSKKSDLYCVIVSFPHGGEKTVSIGQFSSHKHTGGELYDTPTCMGSCGAPIISISQTGGGTYVSQFVHVGTGKVNGVPCGMSVAHFDD